MTDTSIDKPTGVKIEARFVPFPRSVSAEARAALAKLCQTIKKLCSS